MNLLAYLQFMTLRITSPDKATHPHYKRVVNRAKLYEQLITGEDIDDLLKRFFNKETDDEIKKIKQVTESITPAISNALIVAFKKVLRTQPIVKKIDFTAYTEEKKAKVVNALSKYYAGSSLDYYIQQRYHDLTFLDPNAFIVTEFDAFNHEIETASPYPCEVTSAEAINFGLKNGVLQFLLVENQITYLDKEDKEQKGTKLFLYLPDHAVTFTQVARNESLKPADKTGLVTESIQIESRGTDGKFQMGNQNLPTVFVSGDKQFAIQYFTHKQPRVPAERVGYVPDKKTKGETFVSPIHYGAVPYLLKTIKSAAELDLTTHSHTFPQKFEYTEGCNLDANGICQTSKQMVSGCTLCHGSANLGHTTSKDVISFRMPRTKEEVIPLNELAWYNYPPIEGIKFQNDYVNELAQKCYKAVFNSEVFSKDEVQKTATGSNLDIQNAYDPMSDYAAKKSDFWMKTVLMVAVILDIDDCIAEEKYPKDFKMKTVTDLLDDLSKANASEAPGFIITEINRDIAAQLYQDRPVEFLKYEVSQRLQPFSGKTQAEKLVVLNSSDVLRSDKILFNYFTEFVEDLEERSLMADTGFDALLDAAYSEDVPTATKFKEQLAKAKEAKKIWFYDLPFPVQKALLQAMAIQKLDEIESETSTAEPFGGVPVPTA